MSTVVLYNCEIHTSIVTMLTQIILQSTVSLIMLHN